MIEGSQNTVTIAISLNPNPVTAKRGQAGRIARTTHLPRCSTGRLNVLTLGEYD